MLTPPRREREEDPAKRDWQFTLFVGGRERLFKMKPAAILLLFDLIPEEQFETEMAKAPWRLLPLLLMAGLIKGDTEYTLPEDFGELQAGRWALELDEATGQRIVTAFYESHAFIMAAYKHTSFGPVSPSVPRKKAAKG